MASQFQQPMYLEDESNNPRPNESISVVLGAAPKPLAGAHLQRNYQLRVIQRATAQRPGAGYLPASAPHSLLLLGPNLAYAGSADPGCEAVELTINFSEALIQRTVQIMPELQPLNPLLARARQGLAFEGQTLERVQVLIQTLIAASRAERVLLFFQLLGRLALSQQWQTLALTTDADPGGDSKRGDKNRARIQRVRDFLDQNYRHNLSLKTVAASHGVSANYLSRLFKQQTGTGFSAFLINLRIAKACELLSGSERPITQICFDTGFNNISNFNRRFVALKMATPTEYRRAH